LYSGNIGITFNSAGDFAFHGNEQQLDWNGKAISVNRGITNASNSFSV
jgi:hypothetical protein